MTKGQKESILDFTLKKGKVHFKTWKVQTGRVFLLEIIEELDNLNTFPFVPFNRSKGQKTGAQPAKSGPGDVRLPRELRQAPSMVQRSVYVHFHSRLCLALALSGAGQKSTPSTPKPRGFKMAEFSQSASHRAKFKKSPIGNLIWLTIARDRAQALCHQGACIQVIHAPFHFSFFFF